MTKVILVDDHQLVLDGFSQIIKKDGDFEVISIFSEPEEALQKIPILKPDIVVTDMDMPKINGFQLIEKVRRSYSEARYILLTMHMNQLLLKKVKANKLNGFLPKNTDEYEFMQCLRAVKDGRSFYSQKVLDLSVEPASNISSSKTSIKTAFLSDREKEILTLIAHGKSTKEIAEDLFIAVRTVETHRKSIMTKLEVGNVAGMVRIAVQEGLLD